MKDRTDKSYQLMCTYLKNQYFISTIYRQASTIEVIWYFETMVWKWDNITKQRGTEIIEMEDSGYHEKYAIDSHMAMVKKLNDFILEEQGK